MSKQRNQKQTRRKLYCKNYGWIKRHDKGYYEKGTYYDTGQLYKEWNGLVNRCLKSNVIFRARKFFFFL